MTDGLVERERKGFDWVGAKCVLTYYWVQRRRRERTSERKGERERENTWQSMWHENYILF